MKNLKNKLEDFDNKHEKIHSTRMAVIAWAVFIFFVSGIEGAVFYLANSRWYTTLASYMAVALVLDRIFFRKFVHWFDRKFMGVDN